MQIRMCSSSLQRLSLEDRATSRRGGCIRLRSHIGLKLVQAAEQFVHGLFMVGLEHSRGVDKLIFEINGRLGWRKRVTRGWPDGHQTSYATCFYTFLAHMLVTILTIVSTPEAWSRHTGRSG